MSVDPASDIISQDNFSKISSIITEFRNECNPQFLNVKEVFWDRGTDGEEIVYEVHVVIEEDDEGPKHLNTYCYPVANFGRERGMYLYDTVANWDDETVTLRFRFED